MPALSEYKPRTLSEYLKCVGQLQAKAGHVLWFRGAGSVANQLVPTLYRARTGPKGIKLAELEWQLINRFKQRSIPYHDRELRDDWDVLFFMQHYATPTRLLDWTENSLTGLHFALMTAELDKKSKTSRKYKSTAAVWVLDPFAWNQKALEDTSYKGGPLSTADDALNGYRPQLGKDLAKEHPVAIFGAHNSARIVAQQGVFVIFGASQTPMEELVKNGGFPKKSLGRIVIPPSRIASMRKSLLDQGITESTVYPDLEGFSKEMKRQFGFEV